MSNNTDNLSTLKLAAKSAAESFYSDGAKYYGSLEANRPELEILVILERCIRLGHECREALYKLLNALESSNIQGETSSEIAEVKEWIEQLEGRLSKLNADYNSSSLKSNG